MHPPDLPFVSHGFDRGRVRTVVRDDVVWTVWEGHHGQYDRRSTLHLFFECAAVVRRVRSFPSDWRALSDDALMAVAEGR